MNRAHREFLASPDWAKMLEVDLLPWLESVAELGDDVLEVGPGPGLTTDLLRTRTSRVTAVEVDPDLASSLAARMADTNVIVVEADASKSGLEADRFSSATCFSMLHHVPSAEVQNRVFAEVFRVLRPSGVFIGLDSVDDDDGVIRSFHEDDVFVPVDPNTLATRLEAAGFVDVGVDVDGYQVRFSAVKPVR